MRTSTVQRDTKETQIYGKLKIEGRGRYNVATGIRFFDHMLELFTKHGGFDLDLKAAGDLDVDQHHTVEDVGIVLGQLFSKALGDRRAASLLPGSGPPHRPDSRPVVYLHAGGSARGDAKHRRCCFSVCV